MSTVRIPPTLRTATGGEKGVEVSGGADSGTWSVTQWWHLSGLEAQLLGQDGG